MIKLGAPHERIIATVDLSGVGDLVGVNYVTANKGLSCVFVER